MKKFLMISIFILTMIFVFALLKYFESTVKKTIEYLDINSNIVQELYAQVNPSNNSLVLTDLYYNNTISNKYMLTVAISDYLDGGSEIPEFIPEKEIEDRVHDIFGYDTSLYHENTYVLNHDVCGYYYRKEISQYEIITSCGDANMDAFYRKIIKAEKQDDTIKITEKLIYVSEDLSDYIFKVFIYDSYQKEKSLDYFERDINSSRNINIDDYLEGASTYLYTFQLQNGQYRFTSFKKI